MSTKDKEQITALLRDNSIFEGLTARQIDDILPCILKAVHSYGAGGCVCQKGDPSQGLGVVLDGRLALWEPGADAPHTYVEKGGLFGEVDTFSTQCALPCRVSAERDSSVLYLSREFFVHLCSKECCNRDAHQLVIENLLRLLADRSIMLSKKIAYLTATDLKTKIAMYLWELYEVNCSPSFHMPLNRDRLAEFFAVARPSLSRELVNLKNQGVLDFYRSQVTILDLEALRRLTLGENR